MLYNQDRDEALPQYRSHGGVHEGLLRHVMVLLEPDGASLRSSRERRWASATFCGARHIFELETALPGPSAVERLRARLPDHEFSMAGHLVADISLAEACYHEDGRTTLLVEALTVEDR